MLNIKNNLLLVAFYSLVIWIVISSFFDITDNAFLIVSLLILSIAIYDTIASYRFNKKVGSTLGLIKSQYSAPRPLTTMMDALIDNGYFISEIESISLVSYDLDYSCKYLNNSKAIEFLYRKNENIKLSILGYSNTRQKPTCSIDIEINFSTEKISEHKNIIKMKNGKSLLWYEPHHIIRNAKHTFDNGAFLIEPTDSALTNINKEHELLIKHVA